MVIASETGKEERLQCSEREHCQGPFPNKEGLLQTRAAPSFADTLRLTSFAWGSEHWQPKALWEKGCEIRRQ